LHVTHTIYTFPSQDSARGRAERLPDETKRALACEDTAGESGVQVDTASMP